MIIYKFVIVVLFLMMIDLGLKELFKMFKGFRFDIDSIGFMVCFIGMIVLYCLLS